MNFKKFFCGMLSVLCLFSTPLQASAAQNKEMQTTIIEVSENVLTNPNVIGSLTVEY